MLDISPDLYYRTSEPTECAKYKCDATGTSTCSGGCQCKKGYYDPTCSVDCTCSKIQVSYSGSGSLTSSKGLDRTFLLGTYTKQGSLKNDREWYVSDFSSGAYVIFYNPCNNYGYLIARKTSLNSCGEYFATYNMDAFCVPQSGWYALKNMPRDIRITCLTN